MKRTAIKRSSKPLKRTKLKAVSAKRRKEMAQYAILRDGFMKSHPMDGAWLILNGYSDEEIKDIQAVAVIALWEGRNPPAIPARKYDLMALHMLPQYCPRSEDCHHKLKRGKNYLNVDSWLAVGRQIHQKIHDAPGWARSVGLLG
jgi:hypothetical protein